jgi:hypothetical protein
MIPKEAQNSCLKVYHYDKVRGTQIVPEGRLSLKIAFSPQTSNVKDKDRRLGSV